ncbi:MAK10-like protein [Tanacetum coccineum]
MGDENPIRTLGDYSKPSHEGYMNTIELPVGNNVDPNQHLKDFLKLMVSLDLDGKNREITYLRLFQFSLRDQASNWLERLSTESITTWEDLTTRFLAQFFPPKRTAKLRNDILMFQQHHGESLSEAWTRFKDLLQKVHHHGIDLWLQVQIFYDHVNPVTRRTIDQSAGGKLRDRNTEESWALLEDLTLYDNESWNDPRDFSKPVKAIALPQDVPSTSNRRLTELENQVQHLMEAHLAPTQPTQENKVTTSCEICSGPHDTQYCMEDPEQNNLGDTYNPRVPMKQEVSDARLTKFEADFKQQQSEMTKIIDTVLKAITDQIAEALPSDTVKNLKLSTSPSEKQSDSYDEKVKENKKEEKDSPENIHINHSTPPDPSVAFITKKVLKFNSFFESLRLVPQSYDTEVVCTKGDDGEVMLIELIRKNDDSSKGEPEEEGSTTT